jgi:hypothetical protein
MIVKKHQLEELEIKPKIIIYWQKMYKIDSLDMEKCVVLDDWLLHSCWSNRDSEIKDLQIVFIVQMGKV